MVTDGQAKELWRLLAQGKSLASSARMTEMDEKTARSYRDDDRLPSQRMVEPGDTHKLPFSPLRIVKTIKETSDCACPQA